MFRRTKSKDKDRDTAADEDLEAGPSMQAADSTPSKGKGVFGRFSKGSKPKEASPSRPIYSEGVQMSSQHTPNQQQQYEAAEGSYPQLNDMQQDFTTREYAPVHPMHSINRDQLHTSKPASATALCIAMLFLTLGVPATSGTGCCCHLCICMCCKHAKGCTIVCWLEFEPSAQALANAACLQHMPMQRVTTAGAWLRLVAAAPPCPAQHLQVCSQHLQVEGSQQQLLHTVPGSYMCHRRRSLSVSVHMLHRR